ncbi:hypothetical protein J7I84_07015 [Arthrobacter sp. ISL-85]|uniref:hypothetical protein n=1 Tax=Arthrobacter sp. ISL-85 TaxID=2819115 RepID=UPI001BE68334|nr:hypothetical protein [Arthrobacter sp. ISL-85]MBT2566251.1 hypothetical protein [Arthrobacter sp. ISL-85]
MTLIPSKGAGPGARVSASFIAVIMLALLLTGCAPAETGLQRNAASQLQSRVLSVSQAAAANDPAAALKSLDVLEADLATSAREGEVSEQRKRSISTIIADVRSDLTEAQTAAAKAAEAAAAEAEAETEAAATPQEAAPVVPAPAPIVPVPAPAAPVPADHSKGNEGKGKGKND